MSNPVIDRLQQERNTQVEFIDQTLAQVDAQERDLVEAETANLNAARERIRAIDAQLTPLQEFEELRGAHRSTGSGYTSTGDGESRGLGARTEPRTHEYRSAGEVLADAARASASQNDRGYDQRAVDRLESAGLSLVNGHLTRANQLTTDTPGVLPETIVGQIISDVDAARPFMSSVGVKDMGGIPGKTFHRPIVTQHTTVAEQVTEKTALSSQKMVIGDVDFTKKTFGGYVNISRQDIDWTSPSAWDALLRDLQEQYALGTENYAADTFEAAVTAETELPAGTTTFAAATTADLVAGLYGAAAASYAGAKRLPNGIWASLDMWPVLGTLIDTLKATSAGNGGGGSSLDSFAGNLLGVERVIVPSFPTGTLIVGVKERVEVYEDRIGMLSAVEPSILGVEVAYGGYVAAGVLNAAAFSKVVPASA